jgi:hypothetical protein
MEAPIIVIKTPISDIQIELFKWITAQKAEYIEEPALNSVKFGGTPAGGAAPFSVNGFDAKTALHESLHRMIESYVKKVADEMDPKKCLELILQLPEEDYSFIQKAIAKIKEESKKKSQV